MYEKPRGFRGLFRSLEEKVHPIPLKERVDQALYRLATQKEKLEHMSSRLQQRDKEMFQRCIGAQLSRTAPTQPSTLTSVLRFERWHTSHLVANSRLKGLFSDSRLSKSSETSWLKSPPSSESYARPEEESQESSPKSPPNSEK